MNKTRQTDSENQQETSFTVEEAFSQLSEIVEKMDAPDVTLEESIQLYRKGVGLLTRCGDTLDRIEQEMIILTEEGGMPDGEAE